MWQYLRFPQKLQTSDIKVSTTIKTPKMSKILKSHKRFVAERTIDLILNMTIYTAEGRHLIVGGVTTLEDVQALTLSLIYCPQSMFFCLELDQF